MLRRARRNTRRIAFATTRSAVMTDDAHRLGYVGWARATSKANVKHDVSKGTVYLNYLTGNAGACVSSFIHSFVRSFARSRFPRRESPATHRRRSPSPFAAPRDAANDARARHPSIVPSFARASRRGAHTETGFHDSALSHGSEACMAIKVTRIRMKHR